MATAGNSPDKTHRHDEHHDRPEREQLRRDRFQLIIMVLLFAAFFGLVLWMALQAPPSQPIPPQYWPLQ